MKVSSVLFLLSSTAAVSWGACPVGVTADQLIQRTPWAFQFTQGDFATLNNFIVFDAASNPDTLGESRTKGSNGSFVGNTASAAIGVFRASAGGRLELTETLANGNSVSRAIQATGRYVAYADCSGGELRFQALGQFTNLEFVYHSAFDEMYLVAGELTGGRGATTGYARRSSSGCPAVAPLDVLNSTNWSFRTFPALYAGANGSSSVGTFTAQNVGSGRLTGTETINYGAEGPIVRQAQIGGRYTVNADCSGGELVLTNRGNQVVALRLDFVFAGPNYREIYMLSEPIVGSGFNMFLNGEDESKESLFYGQGHTILAGVAKQ